MLPSNWRRGGASQLERNWIGVDIDPHYVEIAEKRVAEEGAALP